MLLALSAPSFASKQLSSNKCSSLLDQAIMISEAMNTLRNDAKQNATASQNADTMNAITLASQMFAELGNEMIEGCQSTIPNDMMKTITASTKRTELALIQYKRASNL